MSTKYDIELSFNAACCGEYLDWTPVQITATNAVDMIADLGTVLDEADVPDEGRYFVIPAWYTTEVIKKWLIKLHNLPAEQ